MKRLLILLLLIPLPAAAEVVRVRSGEHADFSRLVFTFEGAVEWRLSHDRRKVQLIFDRGGRSVDLSQVFTYIPRSRVMDIKDSATGVDLTLGCDCVVEAFAVNAQSVAVDIKNPDNIEESAQTPSLPSDPERPMGLRRPPIRPLGSFGLSVPEAQDETTERPAERSPTSEAFRRELAKQLGRAASQGLLTIDEAAPSAPQAKPLQDTANAAVDASAAEHHQIETAIDQGTALPAAPETFSGAPCRPAGEFAVETWSGHSPQEGKTVIRRSGLLGEFDTPDTQAITALVRTYIFLGFGAEAKATLAAFEIPPQSVWPLGALADIVDGYPSSDPRIHSQASCDTPAALWALLADPDPSANRQVNTQAVQRAFSALPVHLRSHLGPTVADRLLAIGDKEAAMSVRNAIRRAVGADGEGLRLTSARIDLQNGDVAHAEKQLRPVIQKNSAAAPDALLAIVNARLRTEKPVMPEDIENIGALAFEHRGTDLGRRLAQAAISGHLVQQDFDKALVVSGWVGGLSQDLLLSQIYTAITRDAPDAAFLIHVTHAKVSEQLGRLNGPTRAIIADRLMEIGFLDFSAHLLVTPPMDPLEARWLKAKLALKRQDGRAALGHLATLDGPEVLALRAKAYEILGDWPEASRALSRIDASSQEQAEVAWLGGDWAALSEFGTEAQRELSRQRAGIADQGLPSLRSASRHIEDSSALREIVQRLLEESGAQSPSS